ncbi:LamG-like jellyroll fold domain-containing protein [Halorubrum sp. AJ67]|uniref:LamG-like jellyroll fold domain-containing protein n=1 Tax=Halorubrum sp. AJ67 TaxID=1173487 RepID=UPI0003DDEC5A|nr:LamG-like jellyroll fold domain-containing protein [Halorubrum sp. AJ67]CDK39683.1 uncharacterized protein BN903_82 [Halorubrum sp. AJ67]
MSDTVLTIGGELGDDSATAYENLTSLQFTDAASSMGSWTATVPFESSFAESIFADVYIYHNSEMLFRGELESFDTNYAGGTTNVSGRGVLVALDRRTTSVSYSDTTVYDALQDAWADTQYDVNVLPPNRGLFDETYVTRGGHRNLWSYDGDSITKIQNDNVEATPAGTLKFTSTNVVLDEEFGDGSQQASMYPDTNVDRVGVILETVEPVQSMTMRLKSFADGDLHDSSIEVVSDSVSYDTPQRFHIFDFELGQSNRYFRPVLENGDELLEVRRNEAFAIDPAGYATIDELELDGTEFEILQELHDAGAYTFAVRDFDTLDISAFPVNTVAGQPDWRIVDSTRTLDYTDYANRVTVHGRTRDDGTVNTSTKMNSAEVDRLSTRGVGDDGVIERFEKISDVETQSEVDSRAERLLEESVNERDESGSLEVAPQHIAPGFTYSVSNWGDAFPYGGQIGTSSLYFDGDSYVEAEFRDEDDYNYTYEFVIHPQELLELGDGEYQTLFEFKQGAYGSKQYVRVYGDGSVLFGEGSEGGNRATRAPPGTISNNHPQRLSVVLGPHPDRRVYVDGQLEVEFTDFEAVTSKITAGETYRIGADLDGNHGFVGGIDDARIWNDAAKSGDWIFEYHNEDLIEAGADLDGIAGYFRFDDFADPDSVTIDGIPDADGPESSIIGAEFQSTTGQLEEVQYSLGSGETISLDFDISGRIDTELIRTQRVSRSNRRSL